MGQAVKLGCKNDSSDIEMMLHKRQNLVGLLVLLVLGYMLCGIITWYWTPGTTQSNAVTMNKDIKVQSRPQRSSLTPVVIVAYMRTGSSLTGNLLQQDPRVFYVFEPMHHLIRHYLKEKTTQFPNLRFQADRPMMLVREDVEELYRAWFACDMEYILSETYRYHLGFFKYGLKTNSLYKCLNESFGTEDATDRLPCTDMLRNMCLQSRFKVLKTIRTPLIWLKDLMREYPSMRIVHLVRDPRAVIMSQRKFGECSRDKHGGIPGCSKFLCSSMEDDLITSEMFSDLYPGRILTLKYEDLALNPIETTKELYEFVDLEFTDRIQKYIVNITMSGNTANSVLDPIRPDSKAMIDQWREKISDVTLEIVQTMCKYAMKKLSYHHYIKPI